MDEGWADCPYCVKTGYRSGPAGDLGKTRPEFGDTQPEGKAPSAAASAAAAYDPRKTVPLPSIKRAPVVGWLVAMNGTQKGEDFRLRDGKNTLGSEPGAEILVQDPAVSSRHASINYKDGKFVITDLDSTNGTFVNDAEEAVSRIDLKDNDLIRVGETTFKFKCL
jgi:hypothetical protein